MLLSHYDTIELATGIALGPSLAMAACRQYGLELIDIADPEHPRLRWTLEIEGNPGVVKELSGQAIIPGGCDGVLVRPR